MSDVSVRQNWSNRTPSVKLTAEVLVIMLLQVNYYDVFFRVLDQLIFVFLFFKVDGVVVRISSPGGDALASDLMWREV